MIMMGVDPRVWCWEVGEAAVVNDGGGSDCDDRGGNGVDDGDGDDGLMVTTAVKAMLWNHISRKTKNIVFMTMTMAIW